MPPASPSSPPSPAAKAPRTWAVGDRIKLKAGVNQVFREGTSVKMVVMDTDAFPDARVDSVPGRVERAPDGQLYAVADWTVKGRPGRRQQDLKLEFYAEGLGVRSARGKINLRPARLVQVEVGAGGEPCGSVSLRADAATYAVAQGERVQSPTFDQGKRYEFEIPRDYRGKLAVMQGGAALVTVDLSRVPGQDTIKLKLATAGQQHANPLPVGLPYGRPPAPRAPNQPLPVMSAPGYRPPTLLNRPLSAPPSLAGPAGSADAPLLYVCEVPHEGPLANLADGRLYATDRESDAVVKHVHDTVIGVTTEVLDAETRHALKLRPIKFTLGTHEGQRVLTVEANRATRKLFARIEPAVRAKYMSAESEFAQGLTRGASAGARGIAQRSFMALKGKGSWLGVLLIGTGEAIYNYSQGASMLQVLDVFGMTVLKGALSMVLGTAAVGVGVALAAGIFGAVTLTTGALVITAILVGYAVGKLLDVVIPESQISELLHDLGDQAERWLYEFEDHMSSFRHWAATTFSGEPRDARLVGANRV